MSVAPSTISVVIPAHNEAENLARTLPALIDFPYATFREIIIVDDGSTDATAATVKRFAAFEPRVRLIALKKNEGKGSAIRAGLLAATSEVVLYTDADLIYHLADLPHWMQQLASVDMVNGNRRLQESVFHVPTRLFPYVVKRARFGLCFNWFVRQLLPVTTADTQSGLKLYRREVAHRLAGTARERGFAFDVECFALAHIWGYRVAEIPVRLDYRNEVSRVQLMRHGLQMLRALFAIRRRIRLLAGKQAKIAIVNADDYGISPVISAGILEAHARGLVNSISIIPTGKELETALQELAPYPLLATGVHLSVTWGTPLTAHGRAIAGPDGCFSQRAFLYHYCLHPRRTMRALTEEWAAQIERLRAAGLSLTHLDSHHHVHVFPGLQSVILRLAQHYRIPRLRAPHDTHFLTSPRKVLIYLLSRRLAYRVRRSGLQVADHFRGGRLFAARNKGKAIAAIFGGLRPGLTEIYCHPGHVDTALNDVYQTGRAAELEALMVNVVRSEGQIQITAFPQVALWQWDRG